MSGPCHVRDAKSETYEVHGPGKVENATIQNEWEYSHALPKLSSMELDVFFVDFQLQASFSNPQRRS